MIETEEEVPGKASSAKVPDNHRDTTPHFGHGYSKVMRVRCWTEEEFLASQDAWEKLLAHSDADPLFMSWIWQSTWWRHYGKLLNSHLAIYAGYSSEGRLIGIAPFHVHKAQHRTLLRGIRMELLGSSFRDEVGAFSEYLDFVVDRAFVETFPEAVAEAVYKGEQWADLIIPNTPRKSIAAQFARSYLAQSCYMREADAFTAHVVSLPASFDLYLNTLHSSVRRKLWNHRSKLSKPAISVVTSEQMPEFFARLNVFSWRRWGKSPYETSRTAFFQDFASQVGDRGELRMTYLLNAGAPLSLMFNVRMGETEYNIQSAFNQAAFPHGSPGYLHFGFAIEQALESGMSKFNFLAGSGRHRDYKRDFQTAQEELVTFQSVRAKPLAWLYRGYDRQFFSVIGGCAPCMGALWDSPFGDLSAF